MFSRPRAHEIQYGSICKAPSAQSRRLPFETRPPSFFDFFTFLFFHGTPLACESSHEHSTSIFIGRGFVRGGCMFSRNIFSRNIFSRNMSSRNMFSFWGMELYKKELLTQKLFITFSPCPAMLASAAPAQTLRLGGAAWHHQTLQRPAGSSHEGGVPTRANHKAEP